MRKTTWPGLQAGASWVERKGYIRGSVARDSNLRLWINPVQSSVQFVFKLSLILPRWPLFMSAMSIIKDEVSDLIKLNNQQLCFHTLWSGDKIATYNGIFYDYFFKRTLMKDTLMAKNSEVLPWTPLKKVWPKCLYTPLCEMRGILPTFLCGTPSTLKKHNYNSIQALHSN